jgi:hypothetical protein
VDVHHRFPGLLADPEVAFDVLWSRRETLTIAHTLVTCCDRGGSVVIAGVNALRDNRSDVVASLVDQVQSVFDAEAVHDLAELAERVGAAQTLAPVLQAVGAPVAAPSSGALADLEAWHVRSAAGRVGSARWVLELKRAPMRRWPALTWRAVVLAEDEIVRRYPSAGRGWLHLQLARARRASLGLRQLPRAVRLVREAGRKRRSVERLGQPDDG